MTANKRRIDWEAIRERVSQSTLGTVGDEERLAAVYRKRAVELAAPREQVQEQAGTVAVLSFHLEGGRFGLPLSSLAGVLPLERWTAVPGSPPELLGVINYKGQICSVLDLAKLLSLAPGEPAHDAEYVLLLRRPGREVGLKVGRVEGLLRVVPGTGLDEGVGPAAPYLAAFTTDRLPILSAEALLTHPVLLESPRP